MFTGLPVYGKNYIEQTLVTEAWEIWLWGLFVLCDQGLLLVSGDYYILRTSIKIPDLFEPWFHSLGNEIPEVNHSIFVRNLKIVITNCYVLEESTYLPIFPPDPQIPRPVGQALLRRTVSFGLLRSYFILSGVA